MEKSKNLINYALELSDIKLKRTPLLIRIHEIIQNYSYSLDRIFSFIKDHTKPETARGHLIQAFVPISLLQPLHRDKILSFLTDYCKINPFHKEHKIWEAIIFFFFAVDRRRLINLSFADSKLNKLKSNLLFTVKNPEIKFHIPDLALRQSQKGLSFSHILQDFITTGKLDSFERFRQFLIFSYKFPFLNTITFLNSWSGIKDEKELAKILTPDLFSFDSKYLIFDPKERARVEKFINDDNYHNEILSEIIEQKLKLEKNLLQEEFINNFSSIADVYTDTGTCYYGFNGKIKCNRQIADLFHLSQETPFFTNIVKKFKKDNESVNKYLINGITTEVKIAPIIKNSLEIGYLILLKDVTEEELFKKFSGHDIKNSLISIVSTFALLRENEKLDEDDLLLIESGEKSISSLREKFNDFFSLRSVKMNFSSCNLNFLLNKAVISQNSFAESKRIKLRFLEETASDLKLICDTKKIFRVFENLLSNAIKYSEDGSKVDIQIREEAGSAVICFKDEGYGISEEYGENIFNIGVRQTSSNLDKKVAGSGIGLAVVKKFVTLHKGEIFYKANEDKGTTFTVILPLNREED